jgi:hypothetical protein
MVDFPWWDKVDLNNRNFTAKSYAQLTSTAGDDTFPSFLISQAGHKVISPPDLEAKHFLEILSLKPYLITELCTEVWCKDEGSFFDDIIDFGAED